MICTYLLKIYTRATIINYDENNIEQGSIVSEQYAREDCKQKECGAWYRGRCRYNEQR